jgi:hypothetical protein
MLSKKEPQSYYKLLLAVESAERRNVVKPGLKSWAYEQEHLALTRGYGEQQQFGVHFQCKSALFDIRRESDQTPCGTPCPLTSPPVEHTCAIAR